ncbi:hypothetical protein DTO013E5_8172 [Penicillium roqueforti]|nr:hypothetical protein DTO012A1_5873 [Penicillium roqueforti]KAI2750822.1 hypothetical protein DTO013F2_4481 [Penicillium roqueforti]KAI3202789.1 hypothetical protein DTO013E5_8172 [Penicillium roqueforti]
MTILVLGGRGKTASRLAALLDQAKTPFLVGSSSASPSDPYKSSQFNWLKRDTWERPFEQAGKHGLGTISSIYLVGPPVMDIAPPMIEFVDLARAKGVQRFVLLSASTVEKGGHSMGQVHAYLDSLAEVEYVALRPTWFMENLLVDPSREWIKNENQIITATGDGKIPFVSADDIASVAFHCLTEWGSHKTEYVILGPELLSYGQVAEILTTILGKKIIHRSLTETGLAELLVKKAGIPADFAAMLSAMEVDVKNGPQEVLNNSVVEVTGNPPRYFKDVAEHEKHVWA